MPANRDYQSTVSPYDGPIWQGESVHPSLWSLLCQNDTVVTIQASPPPWDVVVGAPHHAAPGVDLIAETWRDPRTGKLGRLADETVGLLSLAVYTALLRRGVSCKLVIAAHPTDHDPNKTPGCPYWNQLLALPYPSHILELHGAAQTRLHDLELSAGQNHLARPLEIGRRIVARIGGSYSLAAQAQPAKAAGRLLSHPKEPPCRLQNPALRTKLLHTAGQAGISALHLEAKSIFRQLDPSAPDSPQPTQAAWDLADALADAMDMAAVTAQP